MKQWISDCVFVWIFDRKGDAPTVAVNHLELGKQTIFAGPSPFRGEQCGAAPSHSRNDHHSIAAYVHGVSRHSEPHLGLCHMVCAIFKNFYVANVCDMLYC